ncbi:AraC-type DNA-binding protein [Duganella sp. CF517]|nr:AraC-type DNA-binding protein [Duganella sp. CF517]
MLYRRSAATDPMPCIYGMGLGMTVRGEKRVTLGSDIHDFMPGQTLVTSVDLPVVTYVTRASPDEPYLGLWLQLDARVIGQVAASMDFLAPAPGGSSLGLTVATPDAGLRRALIQLLRLLREPALVPLVGPLVQQEIAVRLLTGEHGPTLRRLVMAGSPSQQIAKVIAWLKQHFTKNFPMDDLATQAHMSPSTFRQHFREVAGMSPLQYLKQLRLQDARQLMLNEDIDAGSAAMRVGYESASQFSREYTRLFGAPPLRDIRRLQES